MFTNLSIDRFKSIRSLSIPCRKVNLFIGAPDTGKTNILDALAFCSHLGWGVGLGPLLRLRQEIGFDALFFRQFFDQPFQIETQADERDRTLNVQVTIQGHDRTLQIAVRPFAGSASVDATKRLVATFDSGHTVAALQFFRSYSYLGSEAWSYTTAPNLDARVVWPVHGANLVYVARHDSRVNDFLKETVAGLDWKLRFDQVQKAFRLSEIRGDEILDYNLDLLSDSLKRLFFYGSIVLSSKEAVIVLDEPDVFAFPPYPKLLGEMIAKDDRGNQFFVTTHNPYFLSAIVEKVPADQLALFVCHRDDGGATGAKLLAPEQVSRVIEMGASVFFNLDDFLA